MAYADLAAMVARFGQEEMIALTVADGAATWDADAVPDAAVAARALADASAMIDGYLASRTTLPLATVPALLEPLCCDIARYMLASRRNDVPPEQMRARYEDALGWLAKVASGQIGLGLDPQGQELPEAGGAAAASFTRGRARVFDADSLGDYTYRRGAR
jgi:phage gp36-like protein